MVLSRYRRFCTTRPAKIHIAHRASPIDWARKNRVCFRNRRSADIMLRAAVIPQAIVTTIPAGSTSEKQFIWLGSKIFCWCDLTHAWAPIGYIRSLVDGGPVQRLTNADRNYRKCPYEEENCIQVDPPYPMTTAGPVVRLVRSPMRGGFEIVSHRYRCVDGRKREKVKSECMPPFNFMTGFVFSHDACFCARVFLWRVLLRSWKPEMIDSIVRLGWALSWEKDYGDNSLSQRMSKRVSELWSCWGIKG